LRHLGRHSQAQKYLWINHKPFHQFNTELSAGWAGWLGWAGLGWAGLAGWAGLGWLAD